MKITSIATVIIAGTGPNVGALQRAEYPTAAQRDATRGLVRGANHVSDEMNRDLHHIETKVILANETADLLVFEECVGKSKNECLNTIEEVLTNNADLMSVASFSDYAVDALRARNETDSNYNFVALRTNYEETHVMGVLGDGMVFYPFSWCTNYTCKLYHPLNAFIISSMPDLVLTLSCTSIPPPLPANCTQIGPWDCNMGQALTLQECCTLIKQSVTTRSNRHCTVPDLNIKPRLRPRCRPKSIQCYADVPYGGVSKPIDQSRIVMHVNREDIVIHPAMIK
jgi:hypothetical protein